MTTIDHTKIPSKDLVGEPLYPDITDAGFYDKIIRKKEFYTKRKVGRILDRMTPDLAIKTYCGQKQFFIQSPQAFIEEFGSPSTPYDRNALIWGTGAGKSIGALALAEKFKPVIDSFKVASGIKSRIYIISSDTSKKMFIRELKRPHFGYITQEEFDRQARLYANKEVEKADRIEHQFRRRIGRYYEFIAYQSFQNRTIGPTRAIKETDKKAAQEAIDVLSNVSLKHSLIIVDEAHNLYNQDTLNEYGHGILSVLDKEPTCRLLLSTGTPMIYSESEIIDFANFLNKPNDRVKKQDIMEYKDGFWQPKKNYEQVLTRMLRGKISFFRGGHPALFPKRTIVGDSIDGRLKFLRLIRCPMTKKHLDAYRQVIASQEDVTFKIEETGLIDIAFPSPKGKGMFIKDEIKTELQIASQSWKNQHKLSIVQTEGRYELKGAFFSRVNLQEWSSKYIRMLDEIQARPRGKILIYHDFKNIVGTREIGEILLQNGYYHEKILPSDTDATRLKMLEYKTFEILDGDVKQYSERESILKRFECAENNVSEGRFLRILVVGRILRESADLKAISQIIIVNGPYSTSETVQIMGRGSRQCSHVMLPPDKRSIEIKILVSSIPTPTGKPSNKELSKEELQYMNAERNYLGIKRTMNIIKRLATDCSLFYADNVRKQEVEQHKGCVKRGDCPEECDFDDCKYTCNPKVLEFDQSGVRLKDLKESDLDLTSFGESFYRTEINVTKDIIKSLFASIVFCAKFDDLVTFVRSYEHYAYDASLIDRKSIIVALDELLDEKSSFVNMHGEKSYLIYAQDMYIAQPITEPQDLLIEERLSAQNRLSAIVSVSLSNYLKRHHEEFTMKAAEKDDVFRLLDKADTMPDIIRAVNNIKDDVQVSLLEESIRYFFRRNVFEEKIPMMLAFTKLMNYFKFYNLLISAADVIDGSIDYSDFADFDGIDRDSTFMLNMTINRSNPSSAKMMSFEQPPSKRMKKHNMIPANRLYVGHLLKEGFLRLYDWHTDDWVSQAAGDMHKREWKENSIVVGVLHRGKSGSIVFKIRQPISGTVSSSDRRRIRKGFVCTSKQKKELLQISKKLGIDDDDDAIISICDRIESELVRRELEERKKRTNVKYYYHFLDLV